MNGGGVTSDTVKGKAEQLRREAKALRKRFRAICDSNFSLLDALRAQRAAREATKPHEAISDR
jgi:hypothetical protein